MLKGDDSSTLVNRNSNPLNPQVEGEAICLICSLTHSLHLRLGHVALFG